MMTNLPKRPRSTCALAALALLILPTVAAAEPLEFRAINGVGNNSSHPQWGAANTQLLRISGDAYYPNDGSGQTIVEPPTRANPREISNTLMSQGSFDMPNNRFMSSMLWQWGQFVDHDIDLTDSNSANGTADIPVEGVGDPLGPNAMPFSRSNYDPLTGDSSDNPRQQINQITAYLDASNVYGSDPLRAAALRAPGGKMATSDGNLLPFNTDHFPNAGGTGAELFLAGDIRANEQVGLTALHTLFVREHNRLVDLLAVQRPDADDDELYETARRIVGAELQSITYNQFLPALLGPMAPDPEDYHYDLNLNPSIANEFSTALYRVGHTLLTPELPMVDSDGNQHGALSLRDAFFNPGFLEENPLRVDWILKGLSTQQAQEIDSYLVDDVRNFLFGPPGAGGLDLASLNIQRGRDHGLPDYNTMRAAYGLDPVSDFDELSSDPTIAAALSSLYGGDVDNIDAWVGALFESHMSQMSVGELIAKSLVDQFTRIRDGDRFFYIGDEVLYTDDILAVIDVRTIMLSDIVHLNTSMAGLRSDMFFMPEPNSFALALVGLIGLAVSARRRRSGR